MYNPLLQILQPRLERNNNMNPFMVSSEDVVETIEYYEVQFEKVFKLNEKALRDFESTVETHLEIEKNMFLIQSTVESLNSVNFVLAKEKVKYFSDLICHLCNSFLRTHYENYLKEIIYLDAELYEVFKWAYSILKTGMCQCPDDKNDLVLESIVIETPIYLKIEDFLNIFKEIISKNFNNEILSLSYDKLVFSEYNPLSESYYSSLSKGFLEENFALLKYNRDASGNLDIFSKSYKVYVELLSELSFLKYKKQQIVLNMKYIFYDV